MPQKRPETGEFGFTLATEDVEKLKKLFKKPRKKFESAIHLVVDRDGLKAVLTVLANYRTQKSVRLDTEVLGRGSVAVDFDTFFNTAFPAHLSAKGDKFQLGSLKNCNLSVRDELEVVKIASADTVYEGTLGEFSSIVEMAHPWIIYPDGCSDDSYDCSGRSPRGINTYVQFYDGHVYCLHGHYISVFDCPGARGSFLLNQAAAADTLASVRALKQVAGDTRCTVERVSVVKSQEGAHYAQRDSFRIRVGSIYEYYYETERKPEDNHKDMLAAILPADRKVPYMWKGRFEIKRFLEVIEDYESLTDTIISTSFNLKKPEADKLRQLVFERVLIQMRCKELRVSPSIIGSDKETTDPEKAQRVAVIRDLKRLPAYGSVKIKEVDMIPVLHRRKWFPASTFSIELLRTLLYIQQEMGDTHTTAVLGPVGILYLLSKKVRSAVAPCDLEMASAQIKFLSANGIAGVHRRGDLCYSTTEKKYVKVACKASQESYANVSLPFIMCRPVSRKREKGQPKGFLKLEPSRLICGYDFPGYLKWRGRG